MHKLLHIAHHHASHLSTKSKYIFSRRRNKFFALIAIINLLFIIQIISNRYTFPNTYIGDISLGWKNTSALVITLNSLMRTKQSFDIHGKIYEYSYEDLGVYLDTDATVADIRAVNNRAVGYNHLTFFASFFLPRKIVPILHFSQQYQEFVENTIYDSSRGDDIVYLDQSNKKLGIIEQTQRFMLDPYTLQIILTESLGSNKSPIIAPLIPADNLIKQSVEQVNTKLESSYQDALTLIIGTQDNHKFFELSPQVLQEVSLASISADKTSISFIIDQPKLLTHISSLWPMIGKLSADPVITDRIATNLSHALSHRASGIVADSFSVPLDGGPNSDGNIADRYIEVDISQQKLYTFLHGKLQKTYRVSTGKDYPTPIGTFEILNRTSLGFSNIYNVWMPWWMGFSYSNELHAFFGIHELPYTLKDGNKIQRPKDFIGVPNTGGCVALGVGEAKEVYQFADIGTKVVIYE